MSPKDRSSTSLPNKNKRNLKNSSSPNIIKRKYKRAQKYQDRKQKSYKDFFDKAAHATVIMKRGRFIECNRVALKMFGYHKKENIIGHTLWDFSPPRQPDRSDSKKKALWFIHSAITKKPQRFHWKHIRKDGKPFEAEVNLKSIKSGGKTVLMATISDITMQKQVENELRESGMKFQLFFKYAPVYCYMVSPEGIILDVNSSALKALGYTKNEIVGQPLISTVYAPSSIKKANKLFMQWKKTGRIRNEELNIITKSGMERTVLLSVNTAKSSSGKVFHSISIQRDITERKQWEEDLKERESTLKSILLIAPIGIGLISRNRYFKYVNDRMCKLTGYSRKELIGKRTRSIYNSEEEFKRAGRVRHEKFRKKEIASLETQFKRKDGSMIDILMRSAPVDPNDTSQGMIFTAMDITDLKKAREELRSERDRLNVLIDGISRAKIGIDIIGSDYKVLYQNKPLVHNFGNLVGKSCYENYMSLEKPCDPCPTKSAIENRKTDKAELAAPNGRYYEVISTPLPDPDGTINKALDVSLDITSRKKNEEILRNYQNKLRLLASKLSLAEERERQNIAEFLHDEIGQKLALARIKLGTLEQTLTSPEYAESLREIHDLIKETIQDTRELMSELNPPILSKLGIAQSIGWIADQFNEKYGLQIQLNDDGKPKPIDKNVHFILLRATRELLMNIIKHSGAKKAILSTKKDKKIIQVTVEDDGIGFDYSKIEPHTEIKRGFGLFNIRERLEDFSGHLNIDSRKGKGTRVIISVPLKLTKEVSGKRKR